MTKCGFFNVIGAPNAGKSTLVNNMIGSKVTIVSPKVQTTRNNIKGIAVIGDTQLIFCDTPGIFFPQKKLEKALVSEALSSLANKADLILVVDSSKKISQETLHIMQKIQDMPNKVILVLNKIDLIKKESLFSLVKQLDSKMQFDKVFMISASKNKGTKDLRDYLINICPKSDFYYPEDQITDIPSRFLASEITREKLFRMIHEELPYSILVESEKWEELSNGSIRIHQVIHVAREGQKKIILGRNGDLIKKINIMARKELEKIFNCKMHLYLHVKVSNDWQDKPYMYENMSLNFPKE